MRTLQEKYNGIQEGKFSKDHFLADARMELPNLVTRFNGYDDAVQILKNRGMIQEASMLPSFSRLVALDAIPSYNNKTNKIVKFAYDDEGTNMFALLDLANKKVIAHGVSRSSIVNKFPKSVTEAKQPKATKKGLADYRYKPTNEMDKYPYEQILRGLRVELEQLGVQGTPTAEQYAKALATVSKNLAKDSIFYTNQVAGVNPKVDLHDKMIPVTAKNTVDTFNGMKKAALKEGFKKLIKKVLSENSKGVGSLSVRPGDVLVNKFSGSKYTVINVEGNSIYTEDEAGNEVEINSLRNYELSESMGDMFGDEETAERSANYGQPGEDEYDFYTNPENYKDEDDMFEMYGEDTLDESAIGDIHILAQESGSLKDFLQSVKAQHPGVDLRRDIEELQHIWNNREQDQVDYNDIDISDSEIDYDDENFSDPFIDGEDDLFEASEPLLNLKQLHTLAQRAGNFGEDVKEMLLSLYDAYEERTPVSKVKEVLANYDLTLGDLKSQPATFKPSREFAHLFNSSKIEDDLFEGKKSLSQLLK